MSVTDDKQLRDLPPGFWYKLFQIMHHTIVIIDDFLCEELGLSRKPKGKYTEGYTLTKK